MNEGFGLKHESSQTRNPQSGFSIKLRHLVRDVGQNRRFVQPIISVESHVPCNAKAHIKSEKKQEWNSINGLDAIVKLS